MPEERRECLYYTIGNVDVEIGFPENKVQCNYCMFCKYEESYKRYSCRLTYEWLLDPMHRIGCKCPIKFKEEEI